LKQEDAIPPPVKTGGSLAVISMEIYTFVCRPDGEMRRGFMHISMEDLKSPRIPKTVVEYCEKAGGCK
jgi:hypothetical protein